MTVLVTGATGTVGAHVVRALGERGVATRAFVRDPEKAARKLLEIANSVEAGLYSRSSAVENDRPPNSIDPDSMPGRLTLIEERLKAMSIELASLMAM